MRQVSDKLKKLSRKLSAKKRGSNNRDKARLNPARTHRKVANQRRDFHYKLALALVRRYAFIFVEDLKVMQRIWGRKVSDLEHALKLCACIFERPTSHTTVCTVPYTAVRV
ncbi:MAG: transposase [Synergistaceae bacterium]|jgi:putative transposase|nr:transposase [Synergistaceae bacterium]